MNKTDESGCRLIGCLLFLALFGLPLGGYTLGTYVPPLIRAVGLGPGLVRTTGTVLRIDEDPREGDSVAVSYAGSDGRMYQAYLTCWMLDCFPSAVVGGTVPVAYLSDDESRAIPDTFFGRVASPAIFTLMGLVMALGGAVFWIVLIASGCRAMIGALRRRFDGQGREI